MTARGGFTVGQRVRLRHWPDCTGRFRGYGHSGFCTIRFRDNGATVDETVRLVDVEALPLLGRGSVAADVTVECVPARGTTPALFSIFLQQRGGDSPIAVAVSAPLEQAAAAFRDQLAELADFTKCRSGLAHGPAKTDYTTHERGRGGNQSSVARGSSYLRGDPQRDRKHDPKGDHRRRSDRSASQRRRRRAGIPVGIRGRRRPRRRNGPACEDPQTGPRGRPEGLIKWRKS